jgi:hypothetical protein
MRPLRTFREALAGPMVQTILVLRISLKLHELFRESMKAQLEVGVRLATNGFHRKRGINRIADTTLNAGPGSF